MLAFLQTMNALGFTFLVCMGFLFATASSAEPTESVTTSLTAHVSSRADDLRAYADILRAEGEYVFKIGQARLAWAQAALVEAQARQEFERARQLYLWINRMQLELRRLARDEAKERRKIEAIEERVVSLSVLNTGKFTQSQYAAFRYLLIRAVPSQVVAEVMVAPVDRVQEIDFIPNRSGRLSEPFSGGNVGQLLTFMGQKDFSVAPFGPAHIALLNMVGALVTAANDRLEAIQTSMKRLRDGTLDIWNPPVPNGGMAGGFPPAFGAPRGVGIFPIE